MKTSKLPSSTMHSVSPLSFVAFTVSALLSVSSYAQTETENGEIYHYVSAFDSKITYDIISEENPETHQATVRVVTNGDQISDELDTGIDESFIDFSSLKKNQFLRMFNAANSTGGQLGRTTFLGRGLDKDGNQAITIIDGVVVSFVEDSHDPDSENTIDVTTCQDRRGSRVLPSIFRKENGAFDVNCSHSASDSFVRVTRNAKGIVKIFLHEESSGGYVGSLVSGGGVGKIAQSYIGLQSNGRSAIMLDINDKGIVSLTTGVTHALRAKR